MADSHSDPKLYPLQPHNNAVLDDLEERADRARRGELVAGIAKRMVGAERSKRRTRTEIRPLAFPIWSRGRMCACAVIERFVLTHPREHVAEIHWYENVASARAAYPAAILLE
jgi:hypothetical protein